MSTKKSWNAERQGVLLLGGVVVFLALGVFRSAFLAESATAERNRAAVRSEYLDQWRRLKDGFAGIGGMARVARHEGAISWVVEPADGGDWLGSAADQSTLAQKVSALGPLSGSRDLPDAFFWQGRLYFVTDAIIGQSGSAPPAVFLAPFSVEAARARLARLSIADFGVFLGPFGVAQGSSLPIAVLGGESDAQLAWVDAGAIAWTDRWLLPATCLAVIIALGFLACFRATQTRAASLVAQEIADLRVKAGTDMLTGLANRTIFYEQLARRAPATANFEPLAVMQIDVDRFKWVNDTLGHAGGDQALAGLARVLRQALGENVCIARTGGDEFSAIIPGLISENMALRLGEDIRQGLARAIKIDGRTFPITASIGFAMAPQHAHDGNGLLRCADMAAYAAKANGRDQTVIYNPDLAAERRYRRNIARELKAALITGEFAVEYQPIVSAGNQALRGVEALVRWNHPVRGRLPPSAFIPVAEDSDLIIAIGNQVIERALRDMREFAPLTVSVNVTGRQLLSKDFPSFVAKALAQADVPGRRLRLEVTETSLLLEQPRLLEAMEALRNLGVTFAIDDFGVGYSSLNYLLLFRFDCLKVDRRFVSGLGTSPEFGTIVSGVVSLARGLGMEIVGEGVENEAQERFLTDAGCNALQGYLLGRPMGIADLRRKVSDEGRKAVSQSQAAAA